MAQLRRNEVFHTGVQVAGQIVEARPDTREAMGTGIRISSAHGTEHAAVDDDAWDEAEEVTGEQDTGSRWQPVYYSLLLEKPVKCFEHGLCAVGWRSWRWSTENENQRAASSILQRCRNCACCMSTLGSYSFQPYHWCVLLTAQTSQRTTNDENNEALSWLVRRRCHLWRSASACSSRANFSTTALQSKWSRIYCS